jgi:SAM-dependent methyltransferase
MAEDDDLDERIADQFSYRSERADIWRAFELLLDTDAFLNLGYSGRYQTHVVGNPQRRLVSHVGQTVASHLPIPEGATLLDVGCGRGGPAVHLARRFGFRVTGVDLVAYNVDKAVENARSERIPARFVVGDATRLPFASGSFAACTAIDALVYLPDRAAAFEALADAIEPSGVFVLSDLLVRADADLDTVDAFAEAWDMPRPGTLDGYVRRLEAADLEVVAFRDLTPNSVGRFRTWTRLFLGLLETPLGGLVEEVLRRAGLDRSAVVTQVRRAHRALPSLQHVLLVARRRPGG